MEHFLNLLPVSAGGAHLRPTIIASTKRLEASKITLREFQ